MTNVRRVLISGAGVAGPSLAWWLARYGFQPTIVERAPALRTGGAAIDFRGPAHLGVLGRMGLLDQIRQQQTHMGEVAYVDARSRPIATMPPELLSGELEILRGDLSRILHDATHATSEYVFGDSICGIDEHESGVRVRFDRAAPADFDLVVGADGLHSNVRACAFGDDASYVRYLGYYVAVFSAENHLALDHRGLLYSEPGRTIGLSNAGDWTRAICYFSSPELDYDRRDLEAQKAVVARAFAGMGWEAPRLLRSMREAPDFYLDSISDVHLPCWHQGRVGLLGDAAYGGTIGGMGTGAAVVGAYVLASELAATPDDHIGAFTRYETRLRAYVTRCQKGAEGVGPFSAPRTRLGIWLRNLMLKSSALLPGMGLMERVAIKRASAIALDDYHARADRLELPDHAGQRVLRHA